MSDLPWQNLRDVVAELKLDESPDDRIAVRRAILRRLKELHTDTTSALSESTSPELKKLTAALQFVREFQRNPTDALALTQVTALAKKTDDSLALIAEALKSVARGTERSVDERAASRLVESRRSISHQLRPPKISLAAISATLAAVYAFPDQVLSSRVLSEYIPIALVIRFWPVGIIGLASLWVIVWWREAGLRNTAERVLGFNVQRRALEALLGGGDPAMHRPVPRANGFSRSRFRRELAVAATDRSLRDDPAWLRRSAGPMSTLVDLVRTTRSMQRWFYGAEIDDATLDSATDIALERFVQREWIERAQAPRGVFDDYYRLGKALPEPRQAT